MKPAQIPKIIKERFRRPRPKGPWRYVRKPDRLRRHTLVTPLRAGGGIFPAMLEAIRTARETIEFETYILRADRIGEQFRDALVERASAGVTVRLLYDALGSHELPGSFLDPLRAAGGRTVAFHPVAPWRPKWGLNQRDHKKILVVDERVGFTGGVNIGLEYAAADVGGDGWLDWHARVEGPAVFDLTSSFRRTWTKSTDEKLAAPRTPGPKQGRNVLGTQVVDNTKVRSRWSMHRAYLHAIHAALRDISIMNAYFIPELNLRRAFKQAVSRGVSVRVIVPSKSDVQVVYYASRHLYRRLIEAGVRIFEWPDTMMHAKVGIIDGAWSTIGSYNLDRRSLLHNLEMSLICIDEPLAAKLQAEFEADLARCREVTLADIDALSTWAHFRDWFWYQLRSQL